MSETPKGTKVPQDHKAKKKTKKERLEVTFRGEVYTLLDEDIRDDIDVVEALDARQMSTATRMMIGEKEYARLKENLKDPDTGRTKASDMGQFFEAMIEQGQDVKN